MASSISLAIRRASSSSSSSSSSKLFFNPLRSVYVRAAPSVSRSFNTNGYVSSYDNDEDDRYSYRRRDPIDVFDPFCESRSIARDLNQVPRSLSHVLKSMDQFMENPHLAAYVTGGSGGSRKIWDVKETDDSLLLRLDMPGLNKDDVKVSVEEGTLTVKGEGKDNPDGEEDEGRRFSTRFDLPPKIYALNAIKAEMKNGVLKLVVPKVKEEKNNVFEVKVDWSRVLKSLS